MHSPPIIADQIAEMDTRVASPYDHGAAVARDVCARLERFASDRDRMRFIKTCRQFGDFAHLCDGEIIDIHAFTLRTNPA